MEAKEIKKVNIVNEIIAYLESNVVSGTWKPGTKIDSENVLSRQLNVSRASVHSAIQHLIALGVLESFQGKGTFVKTASVIEFKNKIALRSSGSEIRKLMEMRIVLEGEICRMIAKTISDESINKLYYFIDNMIEQRTNPQATAFCDLQFHKTLYLETHNDLIIQCLDIIYNEIERQHYIYFDADKILNTASEHSKIAEALKKHDPKAAHDAMVMHLAVKYCEPKFDTSSIEKLEESVFINNLS